MCLRLVARGMSSKEIALQTGFAPDTVDTYLKQAMAKLGASNRRDAARRLVEYEQSQKLVYQSRPLAAPPKPADRFPTTDMKGWRRWTRLPPVGGGVHDLSWSQKSYQVLQVAIVAAVVLLALSLVIAGLFYILR